MVSERLWFWLYSSVSLCEWRALVMIRCEFREKRVVVLLNNELKHLLMAVWLQLNENTCFCSWSFLRETSNAKQTKPHKHTPNSLIPTGITWFRKDISEQPQRETAAVHYCRPHKPIWSVPTFPVWRRSSVCQQHDDGWDSHRSQNNSLTQSLLENTLFINHITNMDMVFMIALNLDC